MNPATQIEYEIVHQTPERVRFRIPLLRSNSDYADALKPLVEAIRSIALVRLNPAASSLIVHYEPGSMSASALFAQLAICIQKASSQQVDEVQRPIAPKPGVDDRPEPLSQTQQAVPPTAPATAPVPHRTDDSHQAVLTNVAALPSALIQRDLAERLGVKSQTLTYWRSRAEFSGWSRDRDPDAVAWGYQSDSKLFLPIQPVSGS